jgi:hypothetical protein
LGVSCRQTSGLATGTFVAVRALVSSSGESAARVRLNHSGAVNPAAASADAFRNLRRVYGIFMVMNFGA